MTLKNLTEKCRAMGLTCRKRDGEYRINYKGGSEETAYYTDDMGDALDTAVCMHRAQQERIAGGIEGAYTAAHSVRQGAD